MQQAFKIDWPDGDTAHIRITQHVIEIIGSIHAAQHWLEIAQPARHLVVVWGLLLHDISHVRWLEHFLRRERATGAATQPTERFVQGVSDNVCSYGLVPDTVLRQV